MRRICPFRVTETFRRNLQSRFFVPNAARVIELVRRQFMAGQYRDAGGDKYEVMVRDIPAVVVMRDATLITVQHAG